MTIRNPPICDECTNVGWLLMNGVRDIDLACNRRICDVESGLCNVKTQFLADVTSGKEDPPPKSVREEDAITWMLRKPLKNAGYEPVFWHAYPNSRKTCDIVVPLRGGEEFWVEVKLAWKEWFNCNGTIGRSAAYRPYLLGSKHKTHSAVDDFGKLEGYTPSDCNVGMMLIGFDSAQSPMDVEVQELDDIVREIGWVSSRITWPDRRHRSCRINCWLWQRSPISELIPPER